MGGNKKHTFNLRHHYLEIFKSRDTLFGCRQSWWCKQCSVAFTARVEELPCLQYNRVSLLLQKFLASVDSYANSKFSYTAFCKIMRNTEISLSFIIHRYIYGVMPNDCQIHKTDLQFWAICAARAVNKGSKGKFPQFCF